MLGHRQLREKYLNFFIERGHKKLESASLVLQGDSTTLFTSSGMQPLVPYLLGEKHPMGNRLVDIQPCIRTVDIDEVGNNRHNTFFEMLGNWSLGDYFKQEQIAWVFSFLIDELGLQKEKLYFTVFEGNKNIPRDDESFQLWKKMGVSEDHIHYYSAKKNWWSRAGEPDKMPPGEPGGPSSEIFYDFSTPHNKAYGQNCHPNCDCGRFMEIGNSVFMQYKKEKNDSLSELPQKNVDFGGGLERLLAACNDNPDVFCTDVFIGIIQEIEKQTGKSYEDEENKQAMRIIADHLKTSVFIIAQGIIPSNKEHGYVLRRLLRRSIVKMRGFTNMLRPDFNNIIETIMEVYSGVYDLNREKMTIINVVNNEAERFAQTLDKGLKMIEKLSVIDGKTAFDLYQSYGFPFELTKELVEEAGRKINEEEFQKKFETHRQLSKKASSGMFKGGLADHSEQVVKYHTATHLIHKALHEVLGESVRQEGSNITGERLRFDFSANHTPTEEEVKRIEEIVNKKIGEQLVVYQVMLPKKEADKLGAYSFFKEKYPDIVSIYCIGGEPKNADSAYSKEFCGGPHVTNTDSIGTIKIESIKKIGANILRLYAR